MFALTDSIVNGVCFYGIFIPIIVYVIWRTK